MEYTSTTKSAFNSTYTPSKKRKLKSLTSYINSCFFLLEERLELTLAPQNLRFSTWKRKDMS
jgi:hypothetical protein